MCPIGRAVVHEHTYTRRDFLETPHRSCVTAHENPFDALRLVDGSEFEKAGQGFLGNRPPGAPQGVRDIEVEVKPLGVPPNSPRSGR